MCCPHFISIQKNPLADCKGDADCENLIKSNTMYKEKGQLLTLFLKHSCMRQLICNTNYLMPKLSA